MTVKPARDGGRRSLGFGTWWRSRGAASALVVGGLLMTLLFVPFTITHGPTSFNEERTLFGLDMHRWGLLLGVAPNVLVAAGFWTLRRRVAGSSRLAVAACTTICAVLWMSAAADLAFRALGPPFGLLVLAPVAVVACVCAAPRGAANARARVVIGVLAAVLMTGCILALIPAQTSDSFSGYRIFGVLVYATAGILWALLGLMLYAPEGSDDEPLAAEARGTDKDG